MRYTSSRMESVYSEKLFEKMKFFLIYSNDVLVKDRLAKQGYRLDILINDEHGYIRREVVRKKYRLDILINDPDWHVRDEVAIQGYGLDILVNDENPFVRKTAHMNYKNMSLIEKFSRFMTILIYKIYNYMNKML